MTFEESARRWARQMLRADPHAGERMVRLHDDAEGLRLLAGEEIADARGLNLRLEVPEDPDPILDPYEYAVEEYAQAGLGAGRDHGYNEHLRRRAG